MTIEMQPTIEVIFKARDGIVTENDIVFTILDFLIINNFSKALCKCSIAHSVVIAFDKDFCTVELLNNLNCFGCLAPKHIAKNINNIAWSNFFVPPTNQLCVHVHRALKRTIVKENAVGMIVMPISNIEFIRHCYSPFISILIAFSIMLY